MTYRQAQRLRLGPMEMPYASASVAESYWLQNWSMHHMCWYLCQGIMSSYVLVSEVNESPSFGEKMGVATAT